MNKFASSLGKVFFLAICILAFFRCQKTEEFDQTTITPNFPSLKLLKIDSTSVTADTTMLPGSYYCFLIEPQPNPVTKNPIRRLFIRHSAKIEINEEDTINSDSIIIVNDTLDYKIFDTIFSPLENLNAFMFQDTLIKKNGVEKFWIITEDSRLQRDTTEIEITVNKPIPTYELDIKKTIDLSTFLDRRNAYYNLVNDLHETINNTRDHDLFYNSSNYNEGDILSHYSTKTKFVEVTTPLVAPTYNTIVKAYKKQSKTAADRFKPKENGQYVAKLRDKEYYILINVMSVSNIPCGDDCLDSEATMDYYKASAILTDTIFNK